MPRLIKEIDPVGDTNDPHPSQDTLASLVEAPLLSACRMLVDKNIRTVSSSANRKDVGSDSYIYICADHLSESNRQMAIQLGGIEANSSHWGRVFAFYYPVGEETRVEEVARHFESIAEQFFPQVYTWANRSTFAGFLQAQYAIDLPTEQISWINSQDAVAYQDGTEWHWPQMVEEAVARGEYYDEGTKSLFANEAEYKKYQESLKYA